MLYRLPVLALKFYRQLALPFYYEIGSAVLVAKSMAAYTDGGSPIGHQAGDVVHHDRLAKHRAVEYVADSTIRAFPHLLQVELCNAGLIRCNGSAFNAHAILPD